MQEINFDDYLSDFCFCCGEGFFIHKDEEECPECGENLYNNDCVEE